MTVHPNPIALSHNRRMCFIFKNQRNIVKGALKIFDPPGNCIYSSDLSAATRNSTEHSATWFVSGTRLGKVTTGSYLAVITSENEDGTIEIFKQIIGVKD